MANDYFKNDLKVIGGILSPVADAYKKDGTASPRHDRFSLRRLRSPRLQ